jgi:deoxyribonuclease V
MILAVDVHYSENHATVAGVVFEAWTDETPEMELVSIVEGIADYQPGQFYKRELPCILKLIEENVLQLECIVVDGLVYLDGSCKAGLGKHLFDALGGKVPVVGVAKKLYKGISPHYEIYRGTSNKPLYVTAVGIDLNQAKEYIRNMHGKYRQPTLLKRVDRVCRSSEQKR